MSESYYMRVCSMNIGDRVIEYPPMTLEFETEFTLGAASAQTKAKIYNPSSDTVSACKKKGTQYARITIDAGYESDHGTCVLGEIVKYELKKGSDDVLELLIGDRTGLWQSTIINKTWRGTISAKLAAKQILSSVGVFAAMMSFTEEYVYNNLAFTGVSLGTALARIAADTKSQFIFKHGQAYFLSEKKGIGKAIVLKPETGLLEYAQSSVGYTAKTLFMYKCWGGSLVTLETESGDVNCKVTKGKQVFSTAGKAETEMTLVKL